MNKPPISAVRWEHLKEQLDAASADMIIRMGSCCEHDPHRTPQRNAVKTLTRVGGLNWQMAERVAYSWRLDPIAGREVLATVYGMNLEKP